MSDLASRSCTACRGDVAPLSQAAAGLLAAQVPEWRLLDEARRIERRFKFKTYAAAFRFVRGASEIAEAEGHHPDISFGWGYASVSLHTHTIKGLHDNDFILAAKYDDLFRQLGAM